jgi:probable F420-dependent oxidoreductase
MWSITSPFDQTSPVTMSARLPMPLDVALPYWFDRPATEAVDIAMNAEAAGAVELWIGQMTTWDSFALGATVARSTSRVTLVCGPLAVKVRDPVSLAMGIASVAAAGGRPAHLAIGASSPVVVEQWHGRPYERMGTAVIDTFRALRPLLAGQRGPGGYRLRLDPPRAELRVAVFGPRLTRFAGEHADGIIVNMCTPEQVVAYRTAIDEAAERAGRPRPTLATWLMAGLDPGPTAFAQVAGQLVAYLHPPGYGEKMAEAGFGDLVARARQMTTSVTSLAAEIPEALPRTFGLFGSPREIVERMTEYRDAGLDRIGICPVTAEDHGGARLLAELSRLAP